MLILKRFYFYLFFVLLLSGAVLLGLPARAAEETCKLNNKVNFTARDPNGTYILNARVDVYKQAPDADGNPRPGTKVGGATINTLTGIAPVSWRNSAMADTYAIRVQNVSNDDASFWYYGFNWSCGEEISLEETLSGLSLDLRDEENNILSNVTFKIYTQLYDENGSTKPIKNKLLGSFNSGSSGKASIYLPQGSVRGLAQIRSDYYVLEVNSGGKSFYLYDIHMTDGQMNNIQYSLSAVKLYLKEFDGRNAIGKKVEVYKQESDINFNYSKGVKIGDITIGSNGYGVLVMPAGEYVFSYKDDAGKIHDFWSRSVLNDEVNNQSLTLEEGISVGACPDNLDFTLIAKDITGGSVPGLKFEIYEQVVNANGLPLAGTKLGGGTIAGNGKAVVSLKPDPKKLYALKIWDKRADLGEFWFFDAIKFVCGYNRQVIKNLPSLRVIIRDAAGNLQKNKSFSVLAQQYDVDHNPIVADNGLIADLKTDGQGQAVIYVSPGNPYQTNQTGSYIVRVKDAGGSTHDFSNINISADKNYSLVADLSGLSGTLQDAGGHLLADKSLKLYSFSGTGSERRLGSVLLTVKTGSKGSFSFEYADGTYALGVTDEYNQENIFWDATIKSGAAKQKFVFNLTEFVLSGLDVSVKSPSLKLFALAANSNGTYVRGRDLGSISLKNGLASKYLAVGQYLAVYQGVKDKEYGLAFYVTNGSKFRVSIGLSSKYLVSSDQSFSLQSAPANDNQSLSSGLKGRILLQVEDKGQAWYVNPTDGKKYALGRPQDAFNLMRRFALGISNSNFAAIENNPSAWRRLAGKILLKTQDSGRAYYFDPVNLQLYSLGRPTDAFQIMRLRGLGITNNNLGVIDSGN
ncbi:MAG: hypothetical protein WC249_03545 [Patescibacteria group bacterium]|jgi:hypothetical protein